MQLESLVAEVGSSFDGRIQRTPDQPGESTRARALRLELRYETEGRGDTDRGTLSSLEIPLDDDGGVNTGFSLLVHHSAPISYDGSLMRIRYEIEARVDIRLAVDPKFTQPVLVIPRGGAGRYDQPHPLPRTFDRRS